MDPMMGLSSAHDGPILGPPGAHILAHLCRFVLAIWAHLGL
jgi:hypothetical protein